MKCRGNRTNLEKIIDNLDILVIKKVSAAMNLEQC